MKKLLLMSVSIFLFVNCKDDDNASGNQNGEEANEQVYLDETRPIDFATIYSIDEVLYIAAGTQDENYGFAISFPDNQIEDINGNYTLNTDDQTYDPGTEFRAGAVYYAGDSQFAQEGEAAIDIDVENEKIRIDVELDVQGEIFTAHFEGNYN